MDGRTAERSPSSQGVYVIRTANGTPVGRVKGESDLIYIGSGHLKARLKAHLNPRSDLKDKWLISLIAKNMQLEVGLFAVEDLQKKESDLLWSYLVDHLELPPANSRFELSKLSEVQKAVLPLLSLSDDEQRKLPENLRKLQESSKNSST